MSYSLTVLNYLKVAKLDKKTGLAPLSLRVTIGGERVEISAKRSWDPARWDKEAGKAKGTKEDARTLNTYLETLRAKLNKHFNQLLTGDEPVTAELLKNTFQNKVARSKSIMEVLTYHNDQVAARVGTDYAPATLRRYRVGLKKVKLFLKQQYQRADMPLDQLNRRFITEFEHFLKTVEGIQHNTAMNYIKYLKKTVLLAISYDWLEKNPFQGLKHSVREVTREFLSTEELARMVEKPFSIRRLDEVRDIFVFSCYRLRLRRRAQAHPRPHPDRYQRQEVDNDPAHQNRNPLQRAAAAPGASHPGQIRPGPRMPGQRAATAGEEQPENECLPEGSG